MLLPHPAIIGRLLLGLAVAALVAATAAAALARHWWAFDLFSHFRLQYLVLAAVLIPAALALRARTAAVVLAAVVAAQAWAVKDMWLGGDPAAAGLPVRVASVNVWGPKNPTPEALLHFARTTDPDLLLVVDARDERWRAVREGLGELYPHRAPRNWRDGAPIILFSRLPIVSASEEPRHGRRPRLVSEVETGGRTIAVVGVHPYSPSPRNPGRSWLRNRELDAIAARVGGTDQPVIVAGDFNATPFSPHFRDLLAEAGLRNAAAGRGWLGTWPSWFWPARVPIDHILVGGPLGVASFERGPSIGSDHFPVVADVRLQPAPPRPDPGGPVSETASRAAPVRASGDAGGHEAGTDPEKRGG